METIQSQILKWSEVFDPKSSALQDILRTMESVVVAYSGGGDSSFLAAAAHHVLGQRALAATGICSRCGDDCFGRISSRGDNRLRRMVKCAA